MYIKPPKSIPDQIYEYLKEQILRDEFHPGERLTQEKVAEQLKVSRMPVREAFRLLEQDGLVERLPQGGLKVTSVTMELIGHVLGTRAALEEYGIELACERISESSIAKLEYIKQQADDVLDQDLLSRAEKAKRFFSLNTEFHDIIYEATGNPYLIKFISQLNYLVLRMRAIALREASSWIRTWEEHSQLLDSLKRRDKVTARRCIKRHIENAASYTIGIVKMERPDDS